eukprot:TRINITY_DN1688_c1_g2_i1.p1 TRINITY_DN1688_c1_g2~~TRINITY_DN1688_c1_g2_i1.p1  ORF type:complete len:383 (+),score=91.98 TRINITY_DN1688_c1_g2_i1:41-1150(+)
MSRQSGAWKTPDGKVEWLADVKDGVYPNVPTTGERVKGKVTKEEGHPFGGGPSVKEWGDKHGVSEQMVNFVKKCGACGKPNAKTLPCCNACGSSLKETAVTTTPNLFTCIVYGYDAVGLSLRHQDEDLLVIDDLLALSPCHLNSIWAKDWIPDARYLFRNPVAGLKIAEKMFAACEKAYKEQFVSNEGFMKSYVKNAPENPMDLIACGFNTPPSQYQLHLQFVMMPLLPFQAGQMLKGVHFTKYRFCPIGYILESLQVAGQAGLKMDITLDTTMESIIEKMDAAGVSYEKHWEKAFGEYQNAQNSHGNWDPTAFASASGILDDEAVKKLETSDKLALQSYGRPYADGKPCVSNHYKFAKTPGTVKEFGV